MRTVKIRRFHIERGAYDCQKDESEVTIRFTIYDQDEDKGAYYGTFIFYPDMTMEIMWEDIDNEEDVNLDIYYSENWGDDISISRFIYERENINMDNYKKL